MTADEHKGIPVLVLANKQDLPLAASPATVAKALHLEDLGTSPNIVLGVVAPTGSGLYEGLDWLAANIKL